MALESSGGASAPIMIHGLGVAIHTRICCLSLLGLNYPEMLGLF
jgi:hypothetical protein